MVYGACHPWMVTAEGVQPVAALSDSAMPLPANENARVKSDWITPAEALQKIQQIKDRLRRENEETQALLDHSPRRKIWDELYVCEHSLRWKYFRATSSYTG